MDWDSDSARAAIKLDVVLELYKRRHRAPYAVTIADLETYSSSYDDAEFHELIDEIVAECESVAYSNRAETRIHLTDRGKPQRYLDELAEQNDWYR
ncbi:hypothetical protein [Natrarchaeobius oligotrophus]|uniref:hypothetical protein n=1 Tax=Natrarchaeobius oligotrophus TaxID=3455743 RepID=UPI000F548551|nr:hypothetical protein [Natrarchaeobius chitinivorans]